MLVEALGALEASAIATTLRGSRWGYAGVNATHIVGIALLFGATLPLDLRLLGLWRSVPLAPLVRVLVPVSAAGVALALPTGLLLFSVRTGAYAGLAVFQLKMLVVAAGLVNALLLRSATRHSAAASEGALVPPRLRAAALVSLAAWLGAILCGRLIAFF